MKRKYQSVLHSLLNDIRAERYRESVFPSENMSARRYSVGLKTVIKVYDEPERRGLLIRRRGAGTCCSR